MIPVKQTILTKEEGGNCFAACLASILELPIEAVPNPALRWRIGDIDGGWLEVQDWLDQIGLRLDSFECTPALWIPEGYWLAIVPSDYLAGESHCVVFDGVDFDGVDFAWDPRPEHTRPRRLDEVTAIDVIAVRDIRKTLAELPELQEAAA